MKYAELLIKRIFFILFLTLALSLNSQINKYGIPFITNYSAETYSGETQNWAVISDNRGVLYFGNNKGLLEYDGVNWRQIDLPNSSRVLSLALDSNGIVFVGAFNELGYLAPNKSGELKYHSLTSLIDSNFRNFDDVWKVYTTSDAVYFGSINYLFKYDYEKITIVGNSYDKKGNLFFFVSDNDIFLGNYLDGLLKYNSEIFQNFLNSDYFAEKYITGLVKIDEQNILIATYLSGIYIFNKTNGVDTLQISIPSFTNEILKKSVILNASKIGNNHFAFSTNSSGLIITDEKFNIINILSSEEKIMDNTIYDTKNTFFQPIWAALNNGISKIEFYSPFRYFDKSFGYEGSVYDIIEYKDKIYFATNVGVYYLNYDQNDLPFFKKTELQKDNPTIECWTFTKIIENNEEKLVVGTNFGIFYVQENLSKKLIINNKNEESDFSVKSFQVSRYNKNILYVGLDNSLYILEFNGNNWILKNEYRIEQDIRSICEENSNTIWLGTSYSGVYKITGDSDYVYYGSEKGFPDLKDIVINLYKDEPIFATPEGLYTYQWENDSIIKFEEFGKEFSSGKFGFYKSVYSENNIWLSCFSEDKYENIIQISLENEDKINRKPYKRPNFKGIHALYYDEEGILWIGTPDAVYTYDTKYHKNYEQKHQTLIRKVYLKNDSILFYGTFYSLNDKNDSILIPSVIQNDEYKNILKYNCNTIIFEWSASFFEDEFSNEYSYFLEGFDKDWSKWTKETKFVFTNLPEGDYIFRVKSKNKYGIEGTEATYSFTILPPWYRTIIAFIFYIIFTALAVFLIVKWYTRKLKKENIRLENMVLDRTAEIRQKNAELEQQKEEIEAQRDEIEAQRDVLVEKNREIEEKSQNINASIHYASRIQRAILPPLTPIESAFSEYFILYMPRDIVSGDFYWFRENKQRFYFVAADCTGHGVPGAFMSMLGVSLLNEIIEKYPNYEAFEILNLLRKNIIKSLHQKDEHAKTQDGMDLALIIYNAENNEVMYSGANNPLVLVRDKNNSIEEFSVLDCKSNENENAFLFEFKADKMPIGVHLKDEVSFTQIKFKALKNDTFYIFSDGYPDQFGGEKGQKFMIRNLKQLFINLYNTHLNEQQKILKDKFFEWIETPNVKTNKTYKQIDDVLIVAVKI